jgi:serine/threonine-protein kinase
LESICLTCLDPNPARRYRQAIDAADALNGFLKEHHLHETPARSTDRDAPLGFTHVEALRESRFGRVVKARSPEGEDVSLHRIDPGNRLRAADRARLADTFRAAVRLRHPYIQAMIHVLEEGGRVTLVQEYLPGGTLSQRLAAGPLNPVAAAAVVVYVAEAIHHAHQQGIFHGDLDPDNVLFAADGTPRVTDFRLVAEIERRRPGPLTGFLDVQLESRPGYKPPEYLLREPIQLTPAADVYALGALLAEMLMGVPPGDVFGTHQGQPDRNWIGLEQAARKAKRAVSVPRALDAVCRKAMEWKPARRHQTALEFAEHVRGSSPVEKGWFTRLFGG